MDGPAALTVAEVQEYLHLKTPQTVIRLIKRGSLAAFLVGRQYRVTTRALADYVAQGEQAAASRDRHRPANVLEMEQRLVAAKQKGAR